jgi:excinuclease ABC subunit A
VRDDDNRGREQSFPSEEPEVEGLAGEACPDCHGARLNPMSRAVSFQGEGIHEVAQWSVTQTRAWIEGLSAGGAMSARELGIARDVITEIQGRLAFLEEVGLGYLTLDRAAPTLSGGEAQRIRLAAQLGSNLQGVCYVLDEPTIGLHPRDNQHPAQCPAPAGRQGQHPGGGGARRGHHPPRRPHHRHRPRRRQARRPADRPGHGGRAGAAARFGDRPLPGPSAGPPAAGPARGDPGHPWSCAAPAAQPAAGGRGRAAGPAGGGHRRVGSGKSTLARDVLLANVAALVAAKGRKNDEAAAQSVILQGCKSLSGWGGVDRVLEVDQTPIGKTPRSCPATYIGFWDAIRKLFAETLEAKARGYAAARFSFNTGEGRCPACEGRACAPSR